MKPLYIKIYVTKENWEFVKSKGRGFIHKLIEKERQNERKESR